MDALDWIDIKKEKLHFEKKYILFMFDNSISLKSK
jgi:hypothetical protein